MCVEAEGGADMRGTGPQGGVEPVSLQGILPRGKRTGVLSQRDGPRPWLLFLDYQAQCWGLKIDKDVQ